MKLDIDDTEVNVIKKGGDDYFSLTDNMAVGEYHRLRQSEQESTVVTANYK